MFKIHLFLVALFFCATTRAQVLPLDTAVRTGKLANGFTYYIRHNNEPKDRVIFYLANKIGSMQEDEDQRGLAHFMEHMSFNGTKHFPKNELVTYLQKAGVRFGADLNAYTSFTETVYQLPLPSDDTAIVRNGLQIMRDWAGEALLETDEINKERGVVLEEKRMRNGAGQRLQEKWLPMQVNNSRYASRLPIGTEQVLNNFTPATVKRFYKDWYRPNQQALIVVGDVDVNSMEKQIKKLFGDLKNPAAPRPVVKYNIPLTGKNQFLSFSDDEQTSTQITILIKQPEVPLKTKAEYRTHVLRGLFNYVLAERLNELSTRPDCPFIQAQGGLQGMMGGLDAFGVSIVPKPGQTKEAFNTVWTEIVRLQQLGITATELQRSKQSYQSRMDNAYNERSKTPSASYVQEYLDHFLKGTAAPGIVAEYALTKEILAGLSLSDVNTLAKQLLKNTNRDIVVAGPAKDKDQLPSEAQVNAWITTAGNQKLAQWKEESNAKGLLSALPAAGKVVERHRLDSLGVTVLTLSNGVKLWIKPTNFRNEEILFSAFSEGGTSVYPDSLFLPASAAGSFIPANGLGDFTPTELGKMLAGKSVQVQPFLQERYEGISGGATPKDLETALQLVYLYFTKPRKDVGLFNNNINRSKAAMANRGNSPEAVFGDTVGLVLGGYHYRRQPPSAAKFDSINLDKAFDIYKERFANAADFTFIFTGSIDTATFIPLVEQYLGSLPAGGKTEKARDLGIHMPAGQISKTVYKGKDDKALVRLFYSGPYTFSEANNIQLNALGSILQYRMTERIREAEGGAYTPQAGVNYTKLPENRYSVSIQFTCAPGNVDKLVKAAADEVEAIKTKGISADDIQKFKAERVRSTETQLQNNQFWVNWLTYVLQNDEPATGIFNYKQALEKVTPASVQEAARKYIDEKNYIKLDLMPQP